jgi:Zn-dependent protease
MNEGKILHAILSLGMLVFSLSLHEFGHAYVAYKLGDPTAKMLGRLTIDPRVHVDPIGTLLFPLLTLLNPGLRLFGWAKPVPVTPENFKNPLRDGALVALAGPAANVFLCFSVLASFSILDLMGFPGLDGPSKQVLLEFLRAFFWLNFGLAVFNLIPLYPLDGSWILKYLLPSQWSYAYSRMERYGGFLLLAIFFTGGFAWLYNPLEHGLFGLMSAAGMERLSNVIF